MLKLNVEVNEYLDENKKLKFRVGELEQEVKNYKTITFSRCLLIKIFRRRY